MLFWLCGVPFWPKLGLGTALAFFFVGPPLGQDIVECCMSSYCSDVGNIQERRDGSRRASPASSLGGGQELDGRRGEGRGLLRQSVEAGMSGCSESTSLSAICLCCGFARERADGKVAEAGVA